MPELQNIIVTIPKPHNLDRGQGLIISAGTIIGGLGDGRGYGYAYGYAYIISQGI